jgi:hypothetical protein
MGIGVSLGVFAVGAILGFAVRAQPSELDLSAVGVILMLVGGIGFGVSLYRDRWQRRVVEESVETGTSPPAILDDDDVVIDPESGSHPARVVVHEHVFPEDHTTGNDAEARHR